MITTYGIEYTCDICGATGAAPPVETGGRLPRYDQQLPDGWTDFGLTAPVQLRTLHNAPISHLCPACAALPAGQLAGAIQKGPFAP